MKRVRPLEQQRTDRRCRRRLETALGHMDRPFLLAWKWRGRVRLAGAVDARIRSLGDIDSGSVLAQNL